MLFRDLVKGAAWLGVAQLLNFGIPLLTVPVVTRALGPSLYGLLAAIGAYAGYVGVVTSFGFSFTAPRSVSKLRDDPGALSEEVSKIIGAQLGLGIVAAAFFGLFVPLLPYSADHKLISFAILTQVFAYAIIPSWFFIGMEKIRDLVVVQLFTRTLPAGIIIAAVRAPSDINLYVGVNCIGAISSAILSFSLLNQHGVRLEVPRAKGVLSTIRGATQLFFSSLAINLYTATNVIIVTLVLGPAAAGSFALAERLTQAASSVIGPAITAVYPFVCRISGREETPEESHTKRTFFQVIIALSALCSIVLFCFAPHIVSLVGGGEFVQSVVVLRLMALCPLLVALSNILGVQTMLPLNMDRHVTFVLSFAAAIGISGLFVLSKFFGIFGAGLTVLLVQSFVTFTMFMILRGRMRVISLFLKPL